MGIPRRYVFRASVVFVAQTASLSVSPEIVAAREDFFNHGWTRINTDEDGFSLIRVHPCSSVVGHIGCGFAALRSIRRMPSCRTAPWPGRRNTAKALPICNRRYARLAICATLNRYRDPALRVTCAKFITRSRSSTLRPPRGKQVRRRRPRVHAGLCPVCGHDL